MNKIVITIVMFLMGFLYPGLVKVSADEINTSQIAISLDVPEGFDLDVYAVAWNKTTGDEFVIQLHEINDYIGRAKVSAGEYIIAQVSVYKDITDKYPFENGQEFILGEKQVNTVVSRLLNYEEIEAQIEDYLKNKEVEEQEEIIEEVTETEEVEMETEEVIEEVIEEKTVKKENFFISLIKNNMITLIVIVLSSSTYLYIHIKKKKINKRV